MTVIKSYSAMKVGMERTNSAAGHINSRFRSCQKAETLDTMVLAQEWMKELSSRADAPRGLVDLRAWRVVVGDRGWQVAGLRRRRVELSLNRGSTNPILHPAILHY